MRRLGRASDTPMAQSEVVSTALLVGRFRACRLFCSLRLLLSSSWHHLRLLLVSSWRRVTPHGEWWTSRALQDGVLCCDAQRAPYSHWLEAVSFDDDDDGDASTATPPKEAA